MTQVFDDAGRVVPATLLQAEPVTVVRERTVEKDSYSAVQVGFGTRKPKNISKAELGVMKGVGSGNFAGLKEFRPKSSQASSAESAPAPKVGDSIDVSVFAPGDKVQVSAISKGKGFQGVVKRHGFHGGPRSHGQKHSEREPGSIGGGLRNKVPKGMRMGGRMGGERVTVKNLKIVQVDLAANTLLVSGAVPGRRGTLVEVRSI